MQYQYIKYKETQKYKKGEVLNTNLNVQYWTSLVVLV